MRRRIVYRHQWRGILEPCLVRVGFNRVFASGSRPQISPGRRNPRRRRFEEVHLVYGLRGGFGKIGLETIQINFGRLKGWFRYLLLSQLYFRVAGFRRLLIGQPSTASLA